MPWSSGQGGRAHRNYIGDRSSLAPAVLMKLEEPEDVIAVLEHLKSGCPLDSRLIRQRCLGSTSSLRVPLRPESDSNCRTRYEGRERTDSR